MKITTAMADNFASAIAHQAHTQGKRSGPVRLPAILHIHNNCVWSNPNPWRKSDKTKLTPARHSVLFWLPIRTWSTTEPARITLNLFVLGVEVRLRLKIVIMGEVTSKKLFAAGAVIAILVLIISLVATSLSKLHTNECKYDWDEFLVAILTTIRSDIWIEISLEL